MVKDTCEAIKTDFERKMLFGLESYKSQWINQGIEISIMNDEIKIKIKTERNISQLSSPGL